MEKIIRTTNLASRVAILGGESSGKSTLAAALAAHYGTVWVPEYLREFVGTTGRVPYEYEQINVAQTQVERENVAALRAGDFLFCDTTPLMTAIYSLICFGRNDAVLDALVDTHHYDFTVVTAPDIPWVSDGLQRDSEAVRQTIHDEVVRRLTLMNLPFLLVQGSVEARVSQVVQFLGVG